MYYEDFGFCFVWGGFDMEDVVQGWFVWMDRECGVYDGLFLFGWML